MKKILITGATSFVGREFLKKADELTKDYEIYCFVRNISKIDDLKKYHVKIVYGDIIDKDSLDSSMKNIDIVIHLAVSHNTGNEAINIEGTKNIIESCKKNKVKRIIYLSSMAVKRKKLDKYGMAKLEIENMIKESKLNYTILRPSVIYGQNNLSLIGKSLTFPLIIPIIGNGKYKINPVYIENVIKVLLLCIKNKKTLEKTYDLAGGEEISYNEIIDICKKHFNIKKIKIHIPISICLIVIKFFPIISMEAVRGINESTNADTTSLKKDLKIKTISFKEGVKNVAL